MTERHGFHGFSRVNLDLNLCNPWNPWRLILAVIALLCLTVPAPAVEILATVNGEPVTRIELERALAGLEREHANSKELERLALQKLIERRLIIQEAERRNITVAGKDFDKALTAVRRRFDDLKSFGEWMKGQGFDDRSLAQALRDGMLAARVSASLVENVRVSEEQIKQYYDTHKDGLRTEEVWLQIITVKEKAAVQQIQAALGRGEDFGRLAQQHSFGVRAAQGGDAGWVNAGTLWPPMREAVSTLKPGQAIGPLSRGEEFLIVRLHARRPGRTKTLAEAEPEIRSRLLSTGQQEAMQAWLKEQEKKAKIEVHLQSK